MTEFWAALDSGHAGYANIVSAAHARTAEKYQGTVLQSIRDASHKSSVKLVKMNLTNEERTGELSALAAGEVGVSPFMDEFLDFQDKDERAFHLLGESHRSHELVSGRRNFYYRQEQGAVVSGGGQTPGSARPGLQAVTMSAAANHYMLGVIWKVVSGTPVFGTQGDIDLEDGANGTIKIRGDHPRLPGMVMGSWAHHQANPVWSNVCGESTVWRANYLTRTDLTGEGVSAGGWVIAPSAATESSTDFLDYMLLGIGTTADCIGNPGTILVADASGTFGDPKEIIVHPHNGLNPGDRLTLGAFGYDFVVRGSSPDTSVARGGYEFINLSMFRPNGMFANGSAGSVMDSADTLTFLGCRLLFPGNMYCYGKATTWKFGDSTDGRVLYDVTDRPNTQDERFIELNTYHSASAGHWSGIGRWTEIGFASNGPYAINAGNTNVLGSLEVSGCWAHHIGTSGGVETKRFDLGNSDMHAFAGKGANNYKISRFYVGDPNRDESGAGSAINLYSIADGESSAPTTGTGQDLSANTIRLGVIMNSNNNYDASNAGMNGVNINGDNDSILYDNSTGNKLNNIVQQIYIDNIVGDPATEGFMSNPSARNDGEAISLHNEQPTTYRNITIRNCTNDFRGQRNFTDACARTIGAYSIIQDTRHIRGPNSQYVWLERANTWGTNTGVLDASALSIFPTSAEGSSTNMFRLGSNGGEMTLASAQALVKASASSVSLSANKSNASADSVFFNATTIASASANA